MDELEENSVSSDEDYVPNIQEADVSEDTDGDTEEDLDGLEVAENSMKRKRYPTTSRKKRKLDGETDLSTSGEGKPLLEEEKKKIEDDVWADFMRDTGFQSRKNISLGLTATKPNSNFSNLCHNNKSKIEDNKKETVKVTQVFEFAGENVTVEKEVPKNSLGAESLKSTAQDRGKNMKSKSNLSGILSQIGKKNKINTLEKSKLDWDKFKKEENLEEELQSHNKGKDGYLEKQDFLQRADLRRFEIEKKIRTVERNKRLNNL